MFQRFAPKQIFTLFGQELEIVNMILWNGQMGILAMRMPSQGTFSIAKHVAESDALSIIRGEDSAKAVEEGGYPNQVSLISTGGGQAERF